METSSGIPAQGSLTQSHLKRIWQKTQNPAENKGLSDLSESHLDRIVLDSLGLGIVEPFQFLYQHRPSYSEFESWIAKTLGAPPSPSCIENTNRLITKFLDGHFPEFPCCENIESPVLDAKDMQFWDQNGYILLKNAIPTEDAVASEQAVWNFLNIDPLEREKWYQRGQVFWVDLFQHPVLNRNRQSARIRKAFAQVWGTEDLIASVDRVSFNPPLKNGVDHSGPSRLHWDTSIAVPMYFDVLGILYLNDVADNQGAFRCVPGFHRNMESWLAGIPENINPRDVDIENLGAVSIGGNAGDLLIWRQDLPHGSGRNLADKPRIAQYITMYPPQRSFNPVWK